MRDLHRPSRSQLTRTASAGLVIRERNYLDVYIYDKWTGNHLPEFQVGERFEPDELSLKEGMTTQPSLLTEADLVSLMDKNGIGASASSPYQNFD